MSEKTEQPTDKKIRDARDQGQVAVSRDLVKVTCFWTVAEISLATEMHWEDALEALIEHAIHSGSMPFKPAMAEILGSGGLVLAAAFATLGIACIVCALVSHWGQFGLLITTQSLTPKLDRLDPVKGLTNLFSKKKLIELLEAIVKLILLGLLLYLMLRNELPAIIGLSGGDPADIRRGFLELLRSSVRACGGLCLFLGVVDFALQKQMHTKSLMMSLDEIKKEYRESEGDPMIKGARRQLARELAMSGPEQETEDADAVVVNPTHFAVALRYDPNGGGVPQVITKGKHEIALAIIARAHQRGIPVLRHVWLARTLYATGKRQQAIPKACYDATAGLYAVLGAIGDQQLPGTVIELD